MTAPAGNHRLISARPPLAGARTASSRAAPVQPSAAGVTALRTPQAGRTPPGAVHRMQRDAGLRRAGSRGACRACPTCGIRVGVQGRGLRMPATGHPTAGRRALPLRGELQIAALHEMGGRGRCAGATVPRSGQSRYHSSATSSAPQISSAIWRASFFALSPSSAIRSSLSPGPREGPGRQPSSTAREHGH